MQFATNHVGHFALASGLHAALAAEGARIVSVSSSGHLRSPVIFDDLNFAFREYTPFLAYGQSKTANVLFAVAATARWARDGITANALMPGGIATNLQRYTPGLIEQAQRVRLPAQDARAGRGDVGPARDLPGAGGHRRPLLRGLRRGARRRPSWRAGERRRRALRARRRQRRASVGAFRAAARRARRCGAEFTPER